MVRNSQDDTELSWEHVRLAAGNVQLVLLKAVLDHQSVPRAQVPALVEAQTIVDGLVMSGASNLQDIADRLARGGVLHRSAHPVIYTESSRTHRIYELISPALNRGRGPRGLSSTAEAPAVTLHLGGRSLNDALDELLSSVRSMQAGESTTVRLVRTS